MSRVLALAIKEVRSYLRDKADLAFSLALPVAIFALMYGALGGQSLFNGTAYVVNDDPDGVYSGLLIERLSAKEGLAVTLLSLEEANAKLSRSDILVFAHIPADFSSGLDSGWSTQIVFHQRGNGGLEGQIVSALIRGEADNLSQEVQIERQVRLALADKGIGGDPIETTVQGLLERDRESPLVMVNETTIGGQAGLVYQFLPGIMAMFVLFAITLGSRALVEERRKGTLERLLTTQLTVGELYVGKFLAGAARGFVQTFILLALAEVVFRLFTPFSFLMMLVVALVFSAAASTLALIIASVSRTDDQAASFSVLFTMTTVMLGGTFFVIPRDSVLYLISKASLNTYVISAFKTVAVSGGSLGNVALELTVLAAVVVVGLMLSRALFRFMSS
jgi:ABC-2 type transport system permease protein